MYRSHRSFSNSRQSSRQSSHKKLAFNPLMLIKTAEVKEAPPAYIPQNSFKDFAICEPLKQNISGKGYQDPTPIQDQIIPHILKKTDVIGLANTGTGKTAAYLIPLIHNVYTNPNQKVLIIAPTRELAIQIESEYWAFCKNMRMNSVLCIGGASFYRQAEGVKRSPNFVIGTPGRLIDLQKRGILDFSTFSSIVLDEVDKMFDMGFAPVMKYIIDLLPQKRHSLFFSATLPDKVNDIVNTFLNNPVRVEVETQKPAINVNQDIIKVDGRSKIDILHDLLISEGFDKVLIFGRTKHGLDKLDKALYSRGFKVAAIHGNKSQGHRQRALSQFKNSYVQILLATDIASRGLDINDVTHVINFDLPQTYEDYIHRIGRTGRANKTGTALSFVD